MSGGDKLNVSLLKSRMVLHGDENFVACLADVLSVSRQTAASRLHMETEFTQSEIKCLVERYGLTDEEVVEIFIEDN